MTIERLTVSALDNPYDPYRQLTDIMRAIPDGISRESVRRALYRLTHKGLARQTEPGYWRLTDKGDSVAWRMRHGVPVTIPVGNYSITIKKWGALN